MGHTQLIDKMSHNTAIRRLKKRTEPAAPEEMKRYFHHPYGMAYRINNEWVPCPGYGDKSVALQPPEDRERISSAEWRPKKKEFPKETSNQKLPIPSREELDQLVDKQGMSIVDIGKHYHCSKTTVNSWFNYRGLETPFMRRKRLKEEQS